MLYQLMEMVQSDFRQILTLFVFPFVVDAGFIIGVGFRSLYLLFRLGDITR